MRIKYSNGNVDIIGNGDSTTYDNYNQHLDYDLSGSGTNIPKILSTAPNSALYPTQNVNGLPVDYKLNIQYNPIFYQVLDIVFKKDIDKFVYNQILLLLQSGDENLGIKLEYFLNKAILGTIYFENFNSFILDEVQPNYDLSYFNNLSKTNSWYF